MFLLSIFGPHQILCWLSKGQDGQPFFGRVSRPGRARNEAISKATIYSGWWF